MADLVLTEEEVRQLEEGEAAGFLLDHPSFLLAIERIRMDCSEGILTSDPGAIQVREDLYQLSRGLSAVTEQLANMSALGTSIRENAELQQPTEDDFAQDDPGE